MALQLLIQCLLLGLVSSFSSELTNLVRKRRQSDLVDFTPECTMEITQMSESCLQNALAFVDTFKVLEKESVSMWASQCADNMYSCIASPDAETGQVLEFFKQLLPKLKELCKEGCMLPIINIIHACLSAEALSQIGLERTQMEDIFDLACIQEPTTPSGEEGEYCMIKAMTTAVFLYEANKISYCDMKTIDTTKCGSTEGCVCSPNCSALVKQGSTLMGCCMGTLLDIEKKLNVSHPKNADLMAPGDTLLQVCGATAEEPCLTSKQQLADQQRQYDYCKSALKANAKSECIELEDSAHGAYIAEMQDINRECAEKKNLGLCKNPHAHVGITNHFTQVLGNLNAHCDECAAELIGIRDNCTVFLPHEARMVFQMMCMHNSDLEHCGPLVVKYEAERNRTDLNTNPCFKGFMPTIANQCSNECQVEIGTMNEWSILACFDALIEYSHTNLPEWQIWHRTCVADPGVNIKNKINTTFTLGPSPDSTTAETRGGEGKQGSLIMTTILGTLGVVVLVVIVIAAVVLFYKRQTIMDMFGYNRFRGDPSLISDVHMEDTFDHDEDNFENY